MTGRLGIDDVTPTVGDGHHPSKAVVGEVIPISASVWREGHDAMGATVVWRGPEDRRDRSVRMVEQGTGLDSFATTIVPDAPGAWTFRVDAWSDPWATALHAVQAKLGAGQTADELANDLEIAAALLAGGWTPARVAATVAPIPPPSYGWPAIRAANSSPRSPAKTRCV